METKTKQLLNVLYILSWVIFIGVCIEAGGSMFSAFYTMVINPVNASNYWVGNDLSALYAHSPGQFLSVASFISITAILKVYMFYLIIKIVQDKKLDITQPFSTEVQRFIVRISALSFSIGLFTAMGAKYAAWIVTKGITMPDTEKLRLGGADVWIFMSVILFIIAQVFKKGIEIQTENELTV